MSEWQMPQYAMSIKTSCGPTSRRTNSNGPNLDSGPLVAKPRVAIPFLSGALIILLYSMVAMTLSSIAIGVGRALTSTVVRHGLLSLKYSAYKRLYDAKSFAIFVK